MKPLDNNHDIDKKPLIDPFMQEESPEALEEKKAKWNDIFNQYPEFADAVIDIYNKRTEKSIYMLLNAFKDIISVM